MAQPVLFLGGETVYLRPLTPEDASPAYLGWLNDPEVLRFRTSKSFPSTEESMRAYIASIPARGDLVLAICDRKSNAHVGNIALNTILWSHRSAECSIMLGAKEFWGRGLSREAIALVTRHGFRTMGLHRIWAESPNPRFNRIVERLGWTREGRKRDAFYVDGGYVDFECWSILETEYRDADETAKR